MPQTAKWIAVNLGRSSLKAWVIGGDDQVIETLSEQIETDEPQAFEATLIDMLTAHIGDRLVPIICCGTLDDQQDWNDVPFGKVPCKPGAAEFVAKLETKDPRLDVVFLPGVIQDNPADVMCGEETKIAGFLAEEPEFDGIVCLPGTHTKWAHISAGEIVSFRSFMTSELFTLLSEQSVLSHSVQDKGWNDIEFENAVADGMSSPQMLGARLFGLRAEALLRDAPATTLKARLWGMLIGLELAGSRPYWLGQNVAIIGEPEMTALYAAALRIHDVPAQLIGADRVTQKGLSLAYNSLFKIKYDA